MIGNKFLGIFLVLCFLVIAGCVSVSTKTKLNKDYSGKKYNRIVVVSTDEDEDRAKSVENAVGVSFENRENDWVKCFYFSDYFYEGSNSDQKNFKIKLNQFIKTNTADAVLFIKNNGSDSESVVTGYSETRYGFNVNRKTVRSIGMVMELYDAKTRGSVWYSKGGSATSSILRSDEDLMSEFILESMQKLGNTGLLDEK